MEVVLLAGGFVRFEGRRVPTDEFVLEIRRRVRVAAGDGSAVPEVRILIEEPVPQGRIDDLLRELQSAGVRHVTLG